MTDPVTLDGVGAIGEFDEKRAQDAVRELLIAVGEDPDREGLQEPRAGWRAPTGRSSPGSGSSPEDVLTTTFDLGHDEMVLVKDIEVLSAPVSTTWCRSSASPTSATSPPPAARSPACRSWPGSWTSSPAARRCRSG